MFSLDNTATQEPALLSIDPGMGATAPTPEIANQRAAKAQYGLFNLTGKTQDEYYQGIFNGQEDALRTEAADAVDFNKVQRLQQYIRVANAENQPLDPDTVVKATEKTAPDSVFEEAFAQRYVDNLYQAFGYSEATRPISWFHDAVRYIPAQVQNEMDRGSGIIARIQFANQQVEELEALVKAQPSQSSFFPNEMGEMIEYKGAGYLGDTLKNLSGIYENLKLRKNVEGSGFFSSGLLLGTNLDNQAIHLLRPELPMDEFKRQFTAILERLKADNPSAALHFAQAVASPSNRVYDDIFNLANTTINVGTAVTPVVKGFKLWSQTRRAVRDMAEGVHDIRNMSPTAAATNAAGDIQETAVQQNLQEFLARINGIDDPVRRSTEAMTANFRIDAANLRTNAGNFQALGNRMAEELDRRGSEIINQIANVQKVNRIEPVVAAENTLRSVAEYLGELHKKPDNTVLNVHGPFPGVANTVYEYEVHYGTAKGGYYKDLNAAENAAEAMGLKIQRTPEVAEQYLQNIPKIQQQIEETKALLEAGTRQGTNQPISKLRAANLKAKVDKLQHDLDYLQSIQRKGKTFTDTGEGVQIRSKEVVHYPAITLDTTQYKNWTEFRKALKANGYTDKQIKETTGIGDSVTFEEAKAAGHGKAPEYGEGWTYGTVEEKGLGYYIVSRVPVPETSDVIKQGLLDATKLNPKAGLAPSWFNGWANATIGWVRSPADVLSHYDHQMRVAATHGPNVLLNLAQREGRLKGAVSGKKIPREYWPDFERLTQYSQTREDPLTGIPGKFFDHIGEVQEWYQQYIRRMPLESEIEAYFTWKKMTRMDHSLRNLRIYTLKHALGGQEHTFNIVDRGKTFESPPVEGVLQMHLPVGSPDSIMFVKGDGSYYRLRRANAIPPKEIKEATDALKQGSMRVIEILEPDHHPLKGFGPIENERVRWVIAPTFKSNPLSIDQLPLRGGGHLVPEGRYSLKTPDIVTDINENSIHHNYRGDKTIMMIHDKAVGELVQHDMNEVNRLLHEGRAEEARNFHLQSKALTFDWDQHMKWYKTETHNGQKIDPLLVPGQKIYLVPRDMKITDLDKSLVKKYDYLDPKTGKLETTFQDRTVGGSLMRNKEVEFAAQRDARQLMSVVRGSDRNPAFVYQQAKLIDPLTTMDRGLSKIIQSTFMDDLKEGAINSWLAQAEPYLAVKGTGGRAVTRDDLRSFPYHYFNSYAWLKNAPLEFVSNMESAHKKIKDFIGMPSVFESFMRRSVLQMAESIEGKTGGRVNIIPLSEIHAVRNPLTFMKSMAYHAYMGLYSLKQFWTQFMTHSNIYAIAPRSAPGGTAAMILHQYLRYNRSPEIVAGIDKALSVKFARIPGVMHGWRPGWFTEAFEALANNGFEHVGSEHVYLNTTNPGRVIYNKGQTFLYWGETPFRLGAESVRTSAWYTSYLEWRTKNPTAPFNRAAGYEVQSRAATLDHGMSRAFSSMAHTGLASPMMQFMAYELRLSEMMFSRRLKPQEKARLFALSTVLYGVPAGSLGWLAFSPFNFGHYFKAKMIDNGYNVGSDVATSTAMEGGLSAIGAVITGYGDPQAGTWYDFSKYGLRGIFGAHPTHDDPETAFFKTFGGSAASMVSNVWARSYGFRQWSQDLITGKTDNRLKVTDIFDPLKEIATAGGIWQTVAALNAHQWFSRNENLLDAKISSSDVMFRFFTGLTDVSLQNNYTMTELMHAQEELEKRAEREFKLQFHRMLQAEDNKDPTQAADYRAKAEAALAAVNYPMEKRSKLVSSAYDDYHPMITRVPWDWAFKHVPEGQQPLRQNQWDRMQQILEKRGKI